MPADTPALLWRAAHDADPSRPFVTAYDGPVGGRVELSGATFDNWVAKTANMLADGLGTVRYDPDAQPGVSNLLDILAACRNASPYAVVEEATSYAGLKERVCDAVIETLRPVRERAVELLGDPAELNRIRAKGAATAPRRSALTTW